MPKVASHTTVKSQYTNYMHLPRHVRRTHSSSSHSTCPPSGWWKLRCSSCARSSCPHLHSHPHHPAAGHRHHSRSGALHSQGHCKTTYRTLASSHSRSTNYSSCPPTVQLNFQTKAAKRAHGSGVRESCAISWAQLGDMADMWSVVIAHLQCHQMDT